MKALANKLSITVGIEEVGAGEKVSGKMMGAKMQ